jgi:hypothetical protein
MGFGVSSSNTQNTKEKNYFFRLKGTPNGAVVKGKRHPSFSYFTRKGTIL